MLENFGIKYCLYVVGTTITIEADKQNINVVFWRTNTNFNSLKSKLC